MVAKGGAAAQTAAVHNKTNSKTPVPQKTCESASTSNPEGATESSPGLKKVPSKIETTLKSKTFGLHTMDLMDVMENSSTRCLRRYAIKLLMFPAFDHVMGVIILFNTLVMVIEIDGSAAGDEAESTSSWTTLCGWAILTIFCLELSARLIAFRCSFWKDPWNIVDFMIVVVDAAFSLVGLVLGDAFPISILRIFRLAKLARISKVLRVFPELRVLLASLVGSTRAIFWGMVLLFFILLVWSMIGVLFINPLVSKMDFGDCDRCQESYSSVMRSMLTLWQQLVASDDWGSVTMDVILKHPISITFFMPMFMSVSMAIMNLILGVVVNVALSSKDQIDEEDEAEKNLLRMERHTHILDVCDQMDQDRSGELSREAIFAKFAENGEFHDSIKALDVTEEEMEVIWTVVDHDKKGYAPYIEFVNRLYSIRSSDTEFMLAYIKYYITLIRHDLLTALTNIEQHVEKDIEKLEEEIKEEITEEMKEVENHISEQTRVTGGSWEVLDENKQKLCRAPESSSVTSRGLAPSQLKEGLRGIVVDCVDDERACDKQLPHDIQALQLSLRDVLLEASRKLESQILLALSEFVIPGSAVDAKDNLQSGTRTFL